MDSHISIHGIEGQARLEESIRYRLAELAHIYDGPGTCRVRVDFAEWREIGGDRYSVQMELALPGRTLVASATHEDDPHICLEEALGTVRHALSDYAAHRRAASNRALT